MGILGLGKGETDEAAAQGAPAGSALERARAGQGDSGVFSGAVTGLVEILRQAQIAAGSTRKPFEFYLVAAALFLVITWLSQHVFDWLEKRASRNMVRGAA